AWTRPLAEFEALLGIPPAGTGRMPFTPPEAARTPAKVGLHPPDTDVPDDAPSVAVHSFQAAIDVARRELGRYSDAYDGLWEIFRPSASEPGKFVRDQGIIHRRDGLLHMRQGGQGFERTGWLLMLQSQVYGLLTDRRDLSLVTCIVNGVKMPRVEATNGLVIRVTPDRMQTPVASPVYWRR